MLKKVFWRDLSHYIEKINPEFHALFDPLSAINKPFFMAEYKYGEYFGKKADVFLPNDNGELYILGSKETPNEIMRHLGYGKNSLPLAMIISKNCEWSSLDPVSGQLITKIIQKPGKICNQDIIFNEDISIENTNNSACAGSINSFILPNIGCLKSHQKIKSDLNIELDPPKTYYDHSKIFKEITKITDNEHRWRAKIIYFSYEWVDIIRNAPDFSRLREYFLKNLWFKEKSKNPIIQNDDPFLSSNIANKQKPTPYILDTSRYLFNLLLGTGISYIPSTDDEYLPLKTIQDIYTNCYQIKYTPSIMVPTTPQNSGYVYYSLQHPSIRINNFKGAKNSSTFQELANIAKFINTFKKHFSLSPHTNPLKSACINKSFNYFHHKANILSPKHDDVDIESSVKLESIDTRFNHSMVKPLHFSSDAKFFRGCIQLHN